MIIIIFFLSVFTFYSPSEILNFIYFLKLLINLLLITVYYKISGHLNKILVTSLYYDINRNGCFCIKFTQWIITRYKMMNDNNKIPDWLNLFNNFYEKCEFHNFEYTKNILENEFNRSIDEVFIEIDRIPIASGSIAQVYKCKYRKNGKVCALKIVHPNIEKHNYTLHFLKFLSHCLNSRFCNYFNSVIPPLDMDIFFDSLENQINLENEAKIMVLLREQFKNDRYILVIPECYYASKKIIIMSFEEGESFSHLVASGYIKYKIMLSLSLFIRSMALIYGLVHCDLHCGNWKVRKIDNVNYQLVIYDFGLLVETNIIHIRKFLLAWETSRYDKLTDSLEYFIKYHPYNKDDFRILKTELEKDFTTWKIKPLNMNKILRHLCTWGYKNRVIYNGIFINQVLVISLIEDEMKHFGLTCGTILEDMDETADCMIKVEYLNYISFCNGKKVFLKLSEYLDSILKDEQIEFTELFHKVEYKLSLNGLKNQPVPNKLNRKPIRTLDF